MKKLAIVLAVGAAALMGGSAANAADNSVKAQAPVAAKQVHTDISSRHRHGHWRHHHHHRRWGHRHHRPYYNSYGYHGGPRHYGGGPGVTFSFGSGGYRGW
jgi:Ni/Co efflux regulator RcnB